MPTHRIDCDLHNFVSYEHLEEYLSPYWRVHYQNPPPTNYSSPVGVLRSDAISPDGGPAGSDPHFVVIDHMDRYDLAFAILNGSGILGASLHPDPDLGNAIVSAYNQCVVEKWLPVDKRYKGSIIINHHDPQASVREIEKWGQHPDMVQVLMASGARVPFGQRVYHPIYEAAAAFDLPVAIHPGTEGAGIAYPPTAAGYPTRYFEWHNILPLNYIGHVNSLVCEGVFQKFPKLRFVCIEGGLAWLPHLMWRMDKNWRALRSTTPWLEEPPSVVIRRHLRFTTQPIEEPERPEQLLQILQWIDAGNTVLFSTDYPHWDFDNPDHSLPSLPTDLEERIFWKNAADLYHLEVPCSELMSHDA